MLVLCNILWTDCCVSSSSWLFKLCRERACFPLYKYYCRWLDVLWTLPVSTFKWSFSCYNISVHTWEDFDTHCQTWRWPQRVGWHPWYPCLRADNTAIRCWGTTCHCLLYSKHYM